MRLLIYELDRIKGDRRRWVETDEVALHRNGLKRVGRNQSGCAVIRGYWSGICSVSGELRKRAAQARASRNSSGETRLFDKTPGTLKSEAKIGDFSGHLLLKLGT